MQFYFYSQKVYARVQTIDPEALIKKNNHLLQITIYIYLWKRLYIHVMNIWQPLKN